MQTSDSFVFGAPSSIVKTDGGWRVAYVAPSPMEVNFFTVESSGVSAPWRFKCDGYCFCRGRGLEAEHAENISKASVAQRFTFEIDGGDEPEFGKLSVSMVPYADAVDSGLLRAVQQEKGRVFVDFGRCTALRSVSVPGAGRKLRARGAWWPELETDAMGDGDLAALSEKDGRTVLEFHCVSRNRYFIFECDGGLDAASIEFDVVPYGYARRLTSETRERKLERMRWWTEARFGMFIHFGLYALPARHEWVKSRECIPDADYDRYFRMFNPADFDAKAWAAAAKAAGMKYAVLTSRHHEGFSLFDTKYSDYKITNTPFGRDLVREFLDAFRAEGLRVGLYYSLLDWHHPSYTVDRCHPRRATRDGDGAWNDDLSEINKGRDMAVYREFMKNQVAELLTQYGKIDIMWFDFSFPGKNGKSRFDWDSEGLLKTVRGLQPDIIVDNRLDLADWEDGWDFATPEQNREPGWVKVNGRPVPWETCQTFSGSWGYHRDESTWKSPFQCIEFLIQTVAHGGNLIMNVGPTARGEFDARALDRLSAYGRWLDRNGASIYGCTAAPAEFCAPPNTLLTYNPKTNRLYMHFLAWTYGAVPLPFADRVAHAQFLHDGSEIQIRWSQLQLPVVKPAVEIPVAEFILR